MILIYLTFLGLAAIAFWLSKNWSKRSRIVVVVVLVLIPNLVAAWIAYIGDRAPPGSVTIELGLK